MKYIPSTSLANTVETLRQWITSELQRLSIILRNEDTAFDTKIEVVEENAQAALVAESTARANADSALSSSITTISSTVSGQTASIQTLQTTTASLSGDVTNLNAQYGVTVSAGKVTGFKLNSSATTSEFIVQADRFAVGNGGAYPFEVIGGVTYLKAAMIQDASITNANIANATITSAKIANATITAANIADATITAAKIANATITNAQIANATITSAKIASVSADTITTGTLSATRILVDGLTLSNVGGTLKVGDSGVGTTQIASDAVTALVTANTTGSGNATAGSDYVVQSAQLVSTGRPVVVDGLFNMYMQINTSITPTPYSTAINFSLVWTDNLGNSGSVMAPPIYHTFNFASSNQCWQLIPMHGIHANPVAGRTYTYQMRLNWTQNPAGGIQGVNVTGHRFLRLQEIKR